MRNLPKMILWVSVFGVAMGFLETAVVVYLRELYYPNNILFPMVKMSGTLIITELCREVATVIMLICLGWLAGRKFITAFAWFLYAFAIWDIFYYIFLKLILGWPESFLTWDILFLIPTLWTGPVIAPIITSIIMIWLSLGILYYNNKYPDIKLNKPEWFLLIFGSFILITGFAWDYSFYMLEKFNMNEIFSYSKKTDVELWSLAYIPRSFNWLIFVISQLIIIFGIALFYMRHYNMGRKS